MRRIAVSVGVLAAAAMMGLSGTGSAYAATGVLTVNGQQYVNPKGCYTAGSSPVTVADYTDDFAYVHSGPGCTGSILEALYDTTVTVPYGWSVSIDNGEVGG